MPYAKCVQQFRISVDANMFRAARVRRKSEKEFIVGFSGSLRWDDSAFRALARYARRHNNVKVLLFGYLSQKQELLFKGLEVIRIPFENYARYANHLASIQPDLLLAQIPHTHSAQSKCYNKYIESGVVGAIGIYSACLPYTEVIKDGINGYLVHDESENGWYSAIERALRNPDELRTLQSNARCDVYSNYTVDKVVQHFVKKINTIMEGDLMDD